MMALPQPEGVSLVLYNVHHHESDHPAEARL